MFIPGMADTAVFARDAGVVLADLGSSRTGLTDAEAAVRLQRVGPNALRVAKPISAWRVLVEQFKSTVVILLIVASAVAVVTGDHVEAAAIAAVLVINTVLGFFTEIKARRAMEALLQLETPIATVIRNGVSREIDATQIVPGDVIHIEAGQSLPADARLIAATDLFCNEAALTGESAPVLKSVAAVAADARVPDRTNMVYKGTGVASGTATAVVVATGMTTELGRIGGLVAAIPDERTPLEHKLDVLGKRFVWLSLGVGALVVVLGALRGLSIGLLIETGIALAIAAVPEGLPAVATIAMAVGVRRMAKRHALVRRLASVETLGSVTVVCTDKTGTLTAGEMTVTAYSFADRDIEVTGSGYGPEGGFLDRGKAVTPADDARLAEALKIGMLANRAAVLPEDGRWVVHGDPTEGALLVAARKGGFSRDALITAEPQIGEIPFSSKRLFMATVHRTSAGMTAMVKGAPGRVLDRCSSVQTGTGSTPLDDAARAALVKRNEALAARGLRVLALASGPVTDASDAAVRNLTFVAFSGTLDPPAIGVMETIGLLREAGIRTVMITGDQRLTADAVARELGILREGDEVMEGKTLATLPEADLAGRIERVAAFSRVSPEDKLKIVSAFQRDGEIVAMLGDGVNDAPALRKSDVGVAMGTRGTDVAKEAAAVVLRDDRFRTIGAAVEQGRVIFDNIRRFVFYLFSCNVAEVFLLLGASVVGMPLPLLPLQILWLNLVTDTFPALALAMEPAEEDVMRRPPRDPDEAILSRRFLQRVLWYAVLLTAVTMAAFLIGLDGDRTASSRALTMSFMTIALAQTFHLANARIRVKAFALRVFLGNRYATGAVMLVVVLQLLAIYVAPLAALLGIEPLGFRDWFVVLGLAIAPVIVGQLLRLSAEARTRRSR